MSDIIGPQQAVLITSRAVIDQFGKKTEKDDVDAVFWHMPVSKEDMTYAVSLPKRKFITRLIVQSGVFAVNFMGAGSEKKVHKCNLLHGEHIDKFKELELMKRDADGIECPVLDEAVAYIECDVIQSVEFSEYVLLIAKIINSKLKSKAHRLFHVKNDVYTTTKDI
jgi:flavin reductase (DIM6/NTAB) family NADH-FMN oxidoreductase RutF